MSNAAPGGPTFQPYAPVPAAPPAAKSGSKVAKGCLIAIGALVAACLLGVAALFVFNLSTRSKLVGQVQELATALASATPLTACHTLQGGESETGCAVQMMSIRSSTPGLVGANVEAEELFIDYDGGREVIAIAARSNGATSHLRVRFAADGRIESVDGAGLSGAPAP